MPRIIIPVFVLGFLLSFSAVPVPAQIITASIKPTASSKLPRADLFKTLAAAQSACKGDSVVWSTLGKSKSFHLSNSRYYGKTKHGAYVCEKTALAAGFHQAKS